MVSCFKKFLNFVLSLILLVNLCGCMPWRYPEDTINALLTVSVFDVGQADCIYIELPDGKNMLIDAGNNNDGEKISSYLKAKKNVTDISFLVGTHPHEDHIGGLDVIINDFNIGEIYMPQVCEDDTPTTKTYEDVLDAIIAKDYSINAAKAGMNILSSDNLKIDILSPSSDDYNGEMNNYSVVIRMQFYDSVMLFMGDAEAAVEKELISSYNNLNADILKVGHHGSSTSTSNEFLEKVSPATAIISCGKDNKYGHPTQKTLTKLETSKTDIFRTDLLGSIIISFDQEGYAIGSDKNICLDGSK